MSSFFFFNDTATTEIYTLSLHDALPISRQTVLMKVGVEVLRRAYRMVEHRIVDLEATNFIRIDRQAVQDILDPQDGEARLDRQAVLQVGEQRGGNPEPRRSRARGRSSNRFPAPATSETR